MNATLHQNAGAAEGKRLFNLFVNDMVRQNIGLGISLDPVKGAKGAEFFADIRIVDVSIDDVADDVVWMMPATDTVCSVWQIEQICFVKQANGFFRGYAAALDG